MKVLIASIFTVSILAGIPSLAGFPSLQAADVNPSNATPGVRWRAPALNEENWRQWSDFVWPSRDELKWRDIRWHNSLGAAAEEAKRLQRPILLWTMNGNPCGET